MRNAHLRALARVLPFLLVAPPLAYGQPVQPPSRAEAAAALNPAATAFTRQQLDQMLAPIALYPDQLLTQVLMASTFPTQVVEAGQWLQDTNKAALKGDDLVAALQPLPWDPSVKSLVAFPQIITLMTNHLDWTEALGLAFANQQIETMARVQFLRQRAVAAGRLRTTPQLRIERDGPEVVIMPADPNLVYVPVYNPAEAYGSWPDSGYPPVYIPPPPDYVAGAIGAGIGFGVGVGVVGPLWGWGHPDWRRHEVVVDRSRYTNITNAANITNNNIVIQNDTWHRTAPVARLPEPTRPPAAAAPGPHPPGTVTPAAVVLPKPPGGPPPAPHLAEPAVVHPPGGPPPGPHPAEPAVVHPPGGPPPAPHPAEPAVVHPPALPPAPHPAAPAAVHPPAPHPAEPAVVHPPAPPPAPPPVAPAAVHPPAAPPGPHPVAPAAVHPPAAPPGPHPAAPAAAHPPAGGTPPAKKPPPKPGEEEHH